MNNRMVQDFVLKGKEIFVGLEDSKKTWKIAVRSDRTVIDRTAMEAKYPLLIRYLTRRFMQRVFDRGDRAQGAHHGHGFGIYPGNARRELLDLDPQGPRASRKVHPGMEIERQQEKSDRRGGANPYRPLQGLRDHGHAVCGRDHQVKEDLKS